MAHLHTPKLSLKLKAPGSTINGYLVIPLYFIENITLVLNKQRLYKWTINILH